MLLISFSQVPVTSDTMPLTLHCSREFSELHCLCVCVAVNEARRKRQYCAAADHFNLTMFDPLIASCSCDNPKTDYNVVPCGDHGTERVKEARVHQRVATDGNRH